MIEATSAIREKERLSGRRAGIIAVNVGVLVGDRERCLTAGMDEFISKPIDSGELIAAVEGTRY